MERDRKDGRCNATTYRRTMPILRDYGMLVNVLEAMCAIRKHGNARARPVCGQHEVAHHVVHAETAQILEARFIIAYVLLTVRTAVFDVFGEGSVSDE